MEIKVDVKVIGKYLCTNSDLKRKKNKDKLFYIFNIVTDFRMLEPLAFYYCQQKLKDGVVEIILYS